MQFLVIQELLTLGTSCEEFQHLTKSHEIHLILLRASV